MKGKTPSVYSSVIAQPRRYVLIIVAFAGCAREAAKSTADVETIEPAKPHTESLSLIDPSSPCPIVIPGSDLSVPVWAGQRDDEPFDVKMHLEQRREKHTEAECVYFTALAEISPDLATLANDDRRDQRIESATALKKRISDYDVNAPGNEPETAETRELLATLRPVFDRMDQAQQFETCVFSTGMQLSQVLPHISAVRDFSRVGVMHIRNVKDSNNFEDIVKVLDRLLRLSRDIELRGPMIQQLVLYAVERVALHGIQYEVLTRQTLTRAQCEALIDLVRRPESELSDPLLEGVRSEYVIDANTLHGLQQGTLNFEALEMQEPSPELLARINYELEWKTLNEFFQFVLDDYARPYHIVLNEDRFAQRIAEMKSVVSRLRENPPKLGEPLPQSFVVILILPAVDRFREAMARRQVYLGAVKASLVIRRFELDQGRTPQTLEEAFRDAGAGPVPEDPYSGDKLKYRVVDGEVRVYSTGKDQVDDKAEADWDYGRQPGDYILSMPVWKR
jgi:hypothetical protein